MLEFMTIAALLFSGACGGAIIGGVYVLRRKPKPDAWAVIESWDEHPVALFASSRDAKAYIRNAKAMGNADAADWVVRGVVLLREEGDPR